MNEIRVIPEFPDYGVSADGKVWRLTPSQNRKNVPYERRCSVASNGYRMVVLKKQAGKVFSFTVHSLIARQFVDGYAAGLEVRHKNGIKTDCRAVNLEWGTRKQNLADRVRLNEHCIGEDTPMATITNRQATIAKRLYADGFRICDCAYIARIPYYIAKSIAYGHNWKHVR